MKMVPKLRFNDYNGVEFKEWERISISNLGTIITGNTPPTDVPENYGNKYLWCSPIDLGINKYIHNTNKKLSSKGFSTVRLIPPNSIMVTCIGSTIGKLGISICEMSTNQQINTIIPRNNNSEFIYYALQYNFPKYISAIAVQAVPIISKSEFGKLLISLPPIEEQQKIASFLSSYDDSIKTQEKLIEKLEIQKKGSMQKIFSQEIRFKDEDGKEFPEWEESELSSCGTFYNGLSGKTKDDFGKGNKKYITYMNVFKNTIADNNMYEVVNIYDNESQNRVEYGDILFTQSSETVDEVGMSSVWLKDEEIYLNSFCFGYRFNYNKKNKIVPQFIAYELRTQELRRRISLQGQGSTRFNISSSRLSNVKIILPSLKEQQKIVLFLSALDDQIEKEKKILKLMKTVKNGLLQQMFV